VNNFYENPTCKPENICGSPLPLSSGTVKRRHADLRAHARGQHEQRQKKRAQRRLEQII
jgi:hypothetical protein